MKKLITLAVVLAVAITLSGCGKKKTIEVTEKTDPKTLTEWMKDSKGSICEIKTPEGDITIKTKGKKVRMDGMPYADMANPTGEITSGQAVYDEDMVYMWGGENGTKFNIKEMEEWSKQYQDGEPAEEYSWEDWAKQAESENFQFACREAKISEAEFEIPQNVEFVDMMEFLNSMQAMFQGFEGGGMMNQEDIEAGLEKFMQ